jgi:hypothetical protein
MVSSVARAAMLSGGLADTQISRHDGPGASAGLFLLSASSAKSFVRINGVREKSAGRGAAQLSQRMLDDVDAVNGSVYALCASNVVGGVCRSSPGTAAIIRRASSFHDLYYPFSDNPLNRAKRRHSVGRHANRQPG